MKSFISGIFLIGLIISCSQKSGEKIPSANVVFEGEEFQKNAISSLKEYIKHDPTNDIAYYKLSKIYFENQDFGLAYENIKKALVLKPKEISYQKTILECLLKLGLYQDAEDMLEQLSDKISESETSQIALEVYTKTGKTEKAIKIIDNLLSQKDSSSFLLSQKAEIIFLKGDTISALNLLQKSYLKDSFNLKTLERLAYYSSFKYEESDAFLYAKKLLKADSSSSIGNYCYALAMKKMNKKDSATVYYEKAIKIDSTFSNALYNVSIIYLQKNKFDKAEKYLRKLTLLKSSNPNIEFKLAVSLMNLGKKEEALKYFEKVDSSNTNYIFAQKSIKKLKYIPKPTTAVVEQDSIK